MAVGEQKMLPRGAAAGVVTGLALGVVAVLFLVLKYFDH
jgi:hypothetical protein